MRVVFFSFHYDDIWRVNQIRNSWYYQESRKIAGFWDGSLRETYQTYDVKKIREIINDGLRGTSVTVVLIGKYTSYRNWVKYEIRQSFLKGNGMFGIYIHNQKDQNGKTCKKGNNPFDWVFDDQGRKLSILFPTYDWKYDDGFNNFADWIENAARDVNRT